MKWDLSIPSWRARLNTMAQYQLSQEEWVRFLGEGLKYDPAFKTSAFKALKNNGFSRSCAS